MCGIIGVVGRDDAASVLLEGLRHLTYRGYDSCGIATVANGSIDRRRAAGRVDNLARLLDETPLAGSTGIAHTRWATHGAPNETNAHPHGDSGVAIVHNGIIENFHALRSELEANGHAFETETDSEAIAHLVTEGLRAGLPPEEAAAAAFARLEGAFAVAALVAEAPGSVFAVRHGCPLAVGLGEGETWVGSDAPALAPHTTRIVFLEEGDRATLTADGVAIRDIDGRPAERRPAVASYDPAARSKGAYRHFMQKEMHEQPIVIGDTLRQLLDSRAMRVVPPELPFDPARLEQLFLVGCGTSSYAAEVARYWFEGIARLPVVADIASEFRYRDPVLSEGSAAVLISQSGETADTLEALRLAKRSSVPAVAMVNVENSTMAREADAVLPIHAGHENAVASTKAFTAQLASLACLALAAARARGTLDAEEEAKLVAELAGVPARMADVLAREAALHPIAADLQHARHILYLGRGTSSAVAREGALKMKEISYIHAEAYPAGELKHGPIALIDEDVPTVAVAPSDPLFAKTASNLSEIAAREGKVVLVSDEEGLARHGEFAWHTFRIPSSHPFVSPLLAVVPLQLLAYHTALLKGTDVDQPRNLAKSVTVE